MSCNVDFDDAVKVLTYWRTIEFLQQDEYEPPKKLEQGNRRYFDLSDYVEDGQEEGNELYEIILSAFNKKQRVKTWGDISFYFGLIRRQDCIDQLIEILDIKEEECPVEQDTDDILLGCFRLTSEGEFKQGSLSVSTVLWTIRKLISDENQKGLDSSIDKRSYMIDMGALEKNLFNIRELQNKESDERETNENVSDQPPQFNEYSLTIETVKKAVERISERYRSCLSEPIRDNREEREKFLMMKVQFYKDKSSIDRSDDFDSWLAFDFFSDDLKFVRDSLDNKDYLKKPMVSEILDYILVPKREMGERRRFDVIHPESKTALKEFLSKSLDIGNYPIGKWPSRYSPALMQQVAINYATANERMPIRNKAIFSVNGPPGTGKTTLLNEIIAANVVSKAHLLAQYDDPDDAFLHYEIVPGSERFTKYWDKWHKIKDDRINDLSILVASYNNKAVENITKNLPLYSNLEKNLKENNQDNELTRERLSEIKDLFNVDKSLDVEALYIGNIDDDSDDDKPFKGKAEGIYKDIFYSEYARDLMGDDAWGLVSVPLGKKSNLGDFYYKVLKRILFDLFRDFKAVESRKPKYLKAREAFIKQKENVLFMINGIHGEFITDKQVDDLLNPDTTISARAHISNPCLTSELNFERIKLFHSALTMMKEFVLSSHSCRDNLRNLSCYWGFYSIKGEKPPKITDEAIISSAYQTLFLFCPAISSTFASIGSMFRDIREPGLFGTLIVDEAGQSEPVAAVGALFRARRAIVVGDPKQLEPVVTDDTNLIKRRLFNDDFYEPYKCKDISVQSFADALNPVGSFIPAAGEEEAPTWVGSPLVVHRRCLDPMFNISNRLSYGGMMKNETLKPSYKKNFLFDQSMWIHFGGDEVGRKNHYVPIQRIYVLSLLNQAFKLNGPNPSIYIISPFKTVVSGIKKAINDIVASDRSDMSDLKKGLEGNEGWLNEHIGTVHTVQGREADEVIFLLGCDSNATRAMSWVNVNLVNVAVSRAKYRLYIIGDSNIWRTYNNHFKFILDNCKLPVNGELPLPQKDEQMD